MPTHVFNFHLQLLLRTLGGALKGHVLQKVSGTIVLGRLVSTSTINPDPDRGRFRADHRFTADAEAVVKCRHIGSGGTQDIVGETRKRAARCCRNCSNLAAARELYKEGKEDGGESGSCIAIQLKKFELDTC